nr:3971_t:CDS:2 [Entrophospora candida]
MSLDEKHQTNGIKEVDDKHHQINGIDENESVFMKKMLGIPAINDMHNFAKESKYGKIGYQMVGSAGNIVSKATKPFQNQIKQADEFAANSIGYVEGKFPSIKKPTADLVDDLKKPIATVGNTIDNKCITPAMNIATSVQSQINQRAVEPTIEIAKKVDASFESVVDVFESTLNTYLPEDQSTNERSVNTTTVDDSTSADLLQTFRAINIALIGQRRLTRRVKAQINSTQEYTGEQLKQLQESNQLLKSASETVASLNQMLLGIVVNVRGTVQNPEIASTLHSKLHDIASIILGNVNKNEDLPKAVQARVIELSQSLLQTTDSIATYVRANANYFPEYIRLKPLTEFFEQRYVEIVKEIKEGEGSPIEKARKVINITTQHTIPLLNDLQESVQSYSSSLNDSFINTTGKVKSRFVGVN